MTLPPTDNSPPRPAAWAWAITLPTMGAHAAAAAGLLLVSLGPGLDWMTAGLFGAVLAAAGLVVGIVFGQPVWAVVLCAVGTLSGGVFGICGLGLLDLPGEMVRVGMFCSLAGGGVFGALLGLWALDFPGRRLDAAALTCLGGFPVVASQFFGCLLGTWSAALGPIALSVGMAAKMAGDRARLRRQMRPVLWPPDAEPPSMPAWYVQPGWASGFGPAHYALAAAFAAIQGVVLSVLLEPPWTAASPVGRTLLAPAKLNWLFLVGGIAIWSALWIFVYPFRSRPGPRRPPRPDGSVSPTTDLPGRSRQDAGWSLISLAVLFATAAEIVVLSQKTHRPFPHEPALLGLLLIAAAVTAAVVLIAAWAFPLIGPVRFSLFSVLYALAVLAAVGGGLFTLWTRALGGG